MINKHEFRHALSRFASGVTVITTTDAGGKRHGITVSAFCSVSLEPPLILICIDRRTPSHHAFEETEFFNVNILREDQQHLSDQFASHLPDKFDGIEFTENERNIPLLDKVLATLECRCVNRHEDGDHTIYIGEIERANVGEGDALIYFRGGYRKLEK